MTEKIKLFWFEIFCKYYDDYCNNKITASKTLALFYLFGKKEEIFINERFKDKRNDN